MAIKEIHEQSVMQFWLILALLPRSSLWTLSPVNQNSSKNIVINVCLQTNF